MRHGKYLLQAPKPALVEMKKESTLLDEELRVVRFWNNITKDEASALRRIAKRKPVGIY